MKKLLVAAIVVLMASPAFAAVQNVKVSGDITTTFLDRDNFNLGYDYGDPSEGLFRQNVFITQTRVRVDADLTDNVSTSVGLVNERAWNAQDTFTGQGGSSSDTAAADNVQLYLASVTMRELLYSPLTVTIGRQIFNYGNGLIIGNGPSRSEGGLKDVAQDLSMSSAEDGIKAVLDYKPLTIDMFYYKHSQINTQGFFNQNSGGGSEDVYGINGNYQLGDAYNTVVEGYLFSRVDGNLYTNGIDNDAYNNGSENPVKVKDDTLFVPGLRASTNPVKGLNVQGELAWQLGNQPVQGTAAVENERRSAMAAQFMATYTLPVLEKYKPTVKGSFTYVSGDKNADQNYNGDAVKSAKTYTAWDQFDQGQNGGTIYNAILPLTNMYIYSLGASVDPLQDVTLSATWSDLISAESYSAENPLYVYQPNADGTSSLTTGTTGAGPLKNKENGLGNELDLGVNYAYTEDVSFGLNVGWFVPGDAFANSNRTTASQAIASVGVKF